MANLSVKSQIQVEFLPPEARNLFEFLELFAIALCIYTEVDFLVDSDVGTIPDQALHPSELMTDPKHHH
jgi:hypothetical protein